VPCHVKECNGAKKVTSNSTTQLKNQLRKAAILIVATAFLAYCIYWLIEGIIWGYTLINMFQRINQIGPLSAMSSVELAALFIQESCSVANSFLLMVCGVFAFQSAVFYVRGNPKFVSRLRLALVLQAFFSLLLVPASIHHLVGVASGWFMVDVFVGLSYLVQALLIAPPLLILSQKLRTPQDSAPIQKWATIAAPTFVFALYFKYLCLWIDTLNPMGPQQATAAIMLGTADCLVTLLVAGAVTVAACIAFRRERPVWKPLAGSTLVLVGAFFLIFTVVAVFVPVYASFWYLTDFWMLSLPVLGVVYYKSKF
jgi:hypothetical protein